LETNKCTYMVSLNNVEIRVMRCVCIKKPNFFGSLFRLFYFVKLEKIGKTNSTKRWAKDKAKEYFLKALASKEKSLSPNQFKSKTSQKR
jgi:hypothetical protein